MAYPNPQHTFVTNFNADEQQAGVELMTDEKGHLYPLSQIVDGNTLGGSFAVTPTNPASLNVNVAPGYIQIPFSGENYAYHGWMESTTSIRVSNADNSNPRRSYIVAYIKRNITYTESVTNNPALLVIAEVAGTPGSSAPAPSNAQIEAVTGAGNPYVILATIYVPAGANSLTVANITDMRQSMSLKNGITLPAGSVADALYSAGPSGSAPVKIAVIGPTDVLPAADPDADILVVRWSD